MVEVASCSRVYARLLVSVFQLIQSTSASSELGLAIADDHLNKLKLIFLCCGNCFQPLSWAEEWCKKSCMSMFCSLLGSSVRVHEATYCISEAQRQNRGSVQLQSVCPNNGLLDDWTTRPVFSRERAEFTSNRLRSQYLGKVTKPKLIYFDYLWMNICPWTLAVVVGCLS